MRYQGEYKIFDVAELYHLDNRARGLSDATVTGYRNKLSIFVNWCAAAGLTYLSEITPTHLRQFLISLQERKLQNRSQVNLAKTVKTFLNFCVRDEILSKSPMDRVQIPKQQKKILPALSPTQIKDMLRACHNSRDLAICYVLLDSGLRASELLNLNMGDVDIKVGTITVRLGKGGKDRTVYIGNKARKTLHQYIIERGKLEPDAPLFISLTTGERLRLFGLAQLIERLRTTAGVEHCTCHTFRRTFAITCLRNGMNIYVLARLMGHTDIIVLRQYLDILTEDLKTAHGKHGVMDNL